MSTWLVFEFLLSSGAVVFAILAVCQKQVASLGFKVGALIATVGLAVHSLWNLYEGLTVLPESALAVQALVFGNAVACAVLIARLSISDRGEPETA